MTYKRKLNRVSAVVILIFATAIPVAAQESAITNGISWLVSNQDVSGLWGTDKKTPFRDAAVAVDVLSVLGADESTIFDGASAIIATATSTVDYLALKIDAMASAGEDIPPDLIDSLASLQNADGGWGYGRGYQSSVFETSLTMAALKGVSYPNAGTMTSGVNYLKTKQNANGGWAFTYGDSSRVFYTSHVVVTLGMLKNDFSVSTNMLNGVNWLKTQPLPDGGFGTGGLSNPYETGLALAAISEVDRTAAAATNAFNYLTDTQLGNGSWNDDAYSTAMALFGIIRHQGVQSRSMALSTGMNLLGLPVEPLDPLTSTDMLSTITGCTEVRGWDRSGQDWNTGAFALVLVDGFFAKVSGDVNVSVFGGEAEAGGCTDLFSGLNAVSVPNGDACYRASSLLSEIDGCTEVHRWDSELQEWLSLVNPSGDTLNLGSDFAVTRGYGYFVRVDAGGQWCTQVCDTTPPVDELPDLFLDASDITIDPNPVSEGEPVLIAAQIHNIGTDTVFSPQLDFYLGDPDLGGYHMADLTVGEDIPPGEMTDNIWGYYFYFTGTGFGEIYIVADYPNLITELDETNNEAHKTIQIVAKSGVGGSSGSLSVAVDQLQKLPCDDPGRRAAQKDSDAPSTASIYNVSAASLTSSSAAIRWITSEFCGGYVNYGSSVPPTQYRNEMTSGGEIHFVQLSGLAPSTTYFYEVVSCGEVDNNSGFYYTITTSPAGAGAPLAVHGRVVKGDSSPAEQVLVTATLTSGATSTLPLAAVTDSTGAYILNAGNFKSASTGEPFVYEPGDRIVLSAESGKLGVGYDTVFVAGAGPLDAGVMTLDVMCGDVNMSGFVDIDDIMFVINYIFLGGPAPFSMEAGNVNCVEIVDIDDIMYLIGYVFLGRCAPCDVDCDGVPGC